MKSLIQPLFARVRMLRSRQKGQTLVEYSLIMVILSIVAIAVYGLIDTQIANIFSGLDNILDTAQASH